MSIMFNVVKKGSKKPVAPNTEIAYLEKDDWDDYSYRTSFNLTVFDDEGKRYDLGHVKIGYKGQTLPSDAPSYTSNHLPTSFEEFKGIFSLGQDVEYYSKLVTMPKDTRDDVLKGLNDVAYNLKSLHDIDDESVFHQSLLRDFELSDIRDRFSQVLRGGAALTPFNFSYLKKSNGNNSEINLTFNTSPLSTPPSNIHVLIGRNGAGKTTILNNMICSLLSEDKKKYGVFYTKDIFGEERIPENYFSSVVLVSFSAFDSFEYPEGYIQDTGTAKLGKNTLDFSYVGLKDSLKSGGASKLKGKKVLQEEFILALEECLRFGHTKELWLNAIERLCSDDNFSEIELDSLAEADVDIVFIKKKANSLFEDMSSGHAIVLLTITKLINEVKQKSLILIDEPEGHLHPPLLAAFMHALSDLLIHRNGISIIATHSPVVLQEVPAKCVWNIIRYSGGVISPQRLEIESYGENVGILTREVFGLEVQESGFHKALADDVRQGLSYEAILDAHSNKLGLEGRSILKALTFNRDKREKNNAPD